MVLQPQIIPITPNEMHFHFINYWSQITNLHGLCAVMLCNSRDVPQGSSPRVGSALHHPSERPTSRWTVVPGQAWMSESLWLTDIQLVVTVACLCFQEGHSDLGAYRTGR